jgi:short-subunit dehydrogenase
MTKETFVIAGGSTGVAKQVVVELVKKGCNVVFGDTGDVVEAENFLNTLKKELNVDQNKLIALENRLSGKLDSSI